MSGMDGERAMAGGAEQGGADRRAARRFFVALGALALLLGLLPLVLPNAFYMDVAIRMMIAAVIVLGLNLLIGYTGQISLGHAGFYGIGAYGSAIASGHFGLGSLPALAVAALCAGTLAWLVAGAILKLRGHYLAMATLGLGILVSIVITNEARWTGGPDGMPVEAFSVLGYRIDGETRWYWVFAALLVGAVAAARNLIDSPAGRALQAIHGSEVAARGAGVDTAAFKTRVFVLSAVVASVMGSLSAHYIGFITPGLAGFHHSIELVTMVVVGGMASIWGSVVGAALISLLPQLLAKFEGWETVAFGLVLVTAMIFLPRGIVPTLAARLARRRS